MKIPSTMIFPTVLVLGLAACGDDDTTGAGGAGTSTSTATSTATSTSSSSTASSSTTSSVGPGGSGGEGPGGGGQGGGANPPPLEDWTRDIVSTDLVLDVTALTGKATIVLAPSASLGASFEIGDLTISTVTDGTSALNHAESAAQIDVGVPSDGGPATIVIEYAFKDHPDFDGWMSGSQLTFLWPYFCGNLFPCKSDPADGLTFTLQIDGVAAGMTAVYPKTIPADAPSYMPAVAIADFTQVDLGTTTKGTQVNVWHLPGQEADVATGTAHLRDVFELYETKLGDYTFGKDVGTVSADWGGGDYGGMEHHPYWHVSSGSIYSEEVNAHEAAHGWYGDGVRIACWEDFILSEGTATYLAAHALAASGVDIWPDYECALQYYCDPANAANTIAYPDTCDAIDILNDPLWSGVPYYKGAYFYRDVATLIGEDVLDQALGEFYVANVGKAAHMQALVDLIKTKTDAAGAAAVDALAVDWLKTVDCPVDFTTLCPLP